MTEAYPSDPSGLTRSTLTRLLRTMDPVAEVDTFSVVGGQFFGNGENKVSTAGRAEVEIQRVGRPSRKMVVKLCRPDVPLQPLYRNEVAFYRYIRPSLDLEIPMVFGADFDEESGTFGLILEDLRDRGAQFPNATTPVSREQLRSLLDILARLHAHFWQNPDLLGRLSVIQSHTEGELFEFFMAPDSVPALVRSEIAAEQFKRELVEWIGTDEAVLYDAVRRVQLHQATLPFTLCHGDCHIGNTYLLPGERGGLLDWQLAARGCWAHDVSYVIITALSISERRNQEKELIRYYLEQLSRHGVVQPPTMEEAWHEYRLAANWCLYIGWLTTPKTHYGVEITACNVIRLCAAVADLGSVSLASGLPPPPPFAW
ncbi:phosphotransferase [Sphingomonas oligophenolica]|uniref:Phosphotransferase n=1 Tax=Sphingomonas oligophenolica TaxID=301154 RepID=A0ABU9YA02_9SPHN